ncbi:MAG TPA: hypothetical protein VEY30_05115, partial [Myxococcaceae bacterium]|nr:hypothetical protein [Myxococcaceae bacterium]
MSTVKVFDTYGRIHYFSHCSPAPCDMLTAWSRNRLQKTATGYVLHIEGEGRLVFNAKVLGQGSGIYNRYFLTEVYSPQNVLKASVTYEQPSGLTCSQSPAGSTPGAPYIRNVTSGDGQRLSFQYTSILNQNINECVISGLSLRDKSGGSATEKQVATYAYIPSPDINSPALLGGAALSEGGKSETYAYPHETFVDGSYAKHFQVLRGGAIQMDHVVHSSSDAVRDVVG